MADITENTRDDLVIMHYYARTIARIINGEIVKLIVTACGHRFNAINTTLDKNKVTCQQCWRSTRMGKVVKW